MSCSSIKHRFDQLKNQGGLNFDEAINLYNDLLGSLDAHRLELQELQKTGDQNRINHLQEHIKDGEQILSELRNMTLQ
ncbi:hypothetical protein Tfer_0202 [Thermincola ferriacetica]|uniref:Uncharacterized protein n=1 Tax=Thermincola ferriacetica TaxID=281456 RepID=A0A0L6W6N6_9FIRM|nr:hypothetical protein [Thermincola ferriacetica]KNZ71126.1 hypothetical protein Tfer_0202 [Thermincola ferriacetica]